MAIASFEPQVEEDVTSSREKRPISRPLSHNLKNEDTLLSQTLKVEKKKVSLVFLFLAQEPRYRHFAHLTIPLTSLPMFQKIK